MSVHVKTLAVELQSLGVRTTIPSGAGATRSGGAGPSDAGFLWVEGTPLTVPVHGDYVSRSPYELVLGTNGRSGTLFRDGDKVGRVTLHPRPKIYDLETADGVPYWKIGLMHLDSFASTVFQRCVYWGTHEQCHFCAIGTSLQAGRTVPVKTPAMLAEVAEAAARLDGAKDVTLTTGSPNRADRGAAYMARCAAAIRDAAELPVQVQIEPPDDFAWFAELRDAGVEALGLHLETFDPDVLARVAPGKAAQGIPYYLSAWEAAVDVFGRGQVSTYFILGLGEARETVLAGCRAAIERGVYPFVVPLRPAPGSILAHGAPPSPEYMMEVYEAVAPLLAEAGMMSQASRAGCVRCQACSALSTFERAFGGGRNGDPVKRPDPGRLDVRIARTPEELRGHYRVRQRVFVEEQALFEGTDRDGWDDTALHVVAVADGAVVGAVRLYPLDEAGLWQGDRLSVSHEARALRAGVPLVRFAVRTAGELGGHLMIARIQEPIVPLFRFLGWERVGGLIEYRGVPHQRMTIPLAGAEPAFAEERYEWALGAAAG